MEKHELLTEVMRRLPKGSKIKVPYYDVPYISTGVFRMYNNDVIMETSDKISEPLVYMHNAFNSTDCIWAEVIND